LLALDGTEISISPCYGSVNSGAKRHKCPPVDVASQQDRSLSPLLGPVRQRASFRPVMVPQTEQQNRSCWAPITSNTMNIFLIYRDCHHGFTGATKQIRD